MSDTDNYGSQDIIKLDLPSRNGSDGYSNLFFRYYSMLASIAVDFRGSEVFRYNMLVDTILATIPDDSVRDNLKAMKKQLIKERVPLNIGVNEKDRLILEINQEVLGEVTGFFDLYMGLSKKIGVSIEACYPDAFYQKEVPNVEV